MEARLDAEFGRDSDDSRLNLLVFCIKQVFHFFPSLFDPLFCCYGSNVYCLPGDSAPQGLEEVDDLYCVACDKTFKSSKA